MWLVARGAMADVVAHGAKPKVAHRFYHVPASNTAVGHLILENARLSASHLLLIPGGPRSDRESIGGSRPALRFPIVRFAAVGNDR